MRHIEKVAAALFQEKSYLETSLKDIADAAGLTKGGIYHYFSSKDEILHFVLDHFMSEGLEDIEEKLRGIKDCRVKIRSLISHTIQHYVEATAGAKIFFHDSRLLPAVYLEALEEKERKYLEITTDILREFFGDIIKAGQLTSLAFLLLGMCSWTFLWYSPRGPVDPQELSEIIYNVFVTGIEGYSRKIDGKTGS